jgi:hypothetical protein
MGSEIAETKHVIRVSTNEGSSCPIDGCEFGWLGLDKFSESVNHVIKAHGYTLLHVGMETSHDNREKRWHSTVAILGSATEPKLRTLESIASILSRKAKKSGKKSAKK